MLIELLGNKVQAKPTAKDWKEAIRISAWPLLDNDSIEEQYIDAMIKNCEEYGAYIVITNLFAIPHASPECGVKKTDAALTILKSPVDLLGKPVQVLFALASIDYSSHVDALRKLSKVLHDPSIVGKLIQTETLDDVKEVLS